MNDSFTISRALAIAKKEVMHILRDPFTIGMAVGIPVVMVVFFGFAIDYNFRDVRIAVFDKDHTRQSRQLIETLSASGYFKVQSPEERATPTSMVENDRSAASMVINPEFGRKALAGRGGSTGKGESDFTGGPEVQILVDGSDNLKTGVVTGYFSGILSAAITKITGSAPASPITVATRFIYNPELNTQWFVVPGLIVIVTGLLSILLTALTVAREWENGSMELLLSTPVQPLEVITGKILPYVVLGLTGIAFVYIFARFIFNVPFQGSYILFTLSCLLFIGVSLAQGILISIMTRQQQRAMQFAMLMGLLPAMILSGFIFPIESMPVFFQYLSLILPARWFMEILRGVFLKGSGIFDLWIAFSVLLFMNVVLIFIAKKRFKRDIEP
jgi:ABC-2 type transport system permease protein